MFCHQVPAILLYNSFFPSQNTFKADAESGGFYSIMQFLVAMAATAESMKLRALLQSNTEPQKHNMSKNKKTKTKNL